MGEINRIVYRELLDGDYRKIDAASNNDPEAGGGARDFRFNREAFDGMVAEMLPERREARREGDGLLYVGEVENEPALNNELVWEPTYPSRSAEKRFRRIHESVAFNRAPRLDGEEAVIAMIIQDGNGNLRIHFERESDLRGGSDGFSQRVSEHIVDCIDSTREERPRWAVKGYIDSTGDSFDTYCHLGS